MKYSIRKDPETTFEDAINALDQGGIGYLAILDEGDKLLGILTDGDIRRAILNRKSNLLEIINSTPQTADYRLPQRKVVQLLKEIHRKHMPLVDENKIYKGVVALDALEFNSKPNRVVIMAGGFGRRLGDLTREVPKPMLQVGKKNMLENLIDIFSDYGFCRFSISVHYKAELIKKYFGDGSSLGVKIDYLEEDKPLGTAGCLSLISEKLQESFFVVNGDVLSAVNFEDLLSFHTNNNADATMCVRKHDFEIPYGVVNTTGNRICSLIEKPIHSFCVNSGIYVLDQRSIELVPRGQVYHMTNLFEDLIKQKKNTLVYELNDYWVDLGSPKDLEAAKNRLLKFY